MIADIEEMDSIIGQFLDFARTRSEEPLDPPTSPPWRARWWSTSCASATRCRRTSNRCRCALRRMGIKRLISNLVDNALAYGEKDVCVATRSEAAS
jgi:signal transduction histidine kinase